MRISFKKIAAGALMCAAAQDFVNFIVSDDGQKIIAANKYIKIQKRQKS